MATILDVAKMAGVSISTVSYALSGARPISAKKKVLIFQSMEKLGYQPNAIAKSLASRKTNNIALLYPPVGERHLGLIDTQFISSCAQYSLKYGYNMVLWVLSADNLDELRKLARQNMVDGIILMEVRQMDTFVTVLHEEGIPFFMIGHDRSFKGQNYVDIDYHSSMNSLIRWLVDLGHKNICFFNHPQKTFDVGYTSTVLCHDFFYEICGEFRVQGTEVFCEADPEHGYRETEKILKLQKNTSVIISSNESCFVGIVKAVEDSGRKIPDHVSLVAFTTAELASERLLPPITSYEIDVDSMIQQAIDELILLIEKRTEIKKKPLIPCKFVRRHSTGPAVNPEAR